MNIICVFILLLFLFLLFNGVWYLLGGKEFNDDVRENSNCSMSVFSNLITIFVFIILVCLLNRAYPLLSIRMPNFTEIIPMVWKAIWAAFVPGGLVFCLVSFLVEKIENIFKIKPGLVSFKLPISLAFVFMVLLFIVL